MWARERSPLCRYSSRRRQRAWLAACVALSTATSIVYAGPLEDELPRRALEQGRELFTREWLPGDPAGHKGDGLGPMYNDTSCVACHNQGGAGGAGSSSKNVDLITAVVTPVKGEAGAGRRVFRKNARNQVQARRNARRSAGEAASQGRAAGPGLARRVAWRLPCNFEFGSASVWI